MSDFDYGNIKPNGQYERYPTSIQPDYRQPIRNTYRHTVCGTTTRCGDGIAKTYATNPHYYGYTFCVACRTHPPLEEFTWEPDGAPMNKVFGNPGQDLRLPLREFPGHYPIWGVDV